MEGWKNGREALFKQLAEVYDGIGHNISIELNDESYTRISREELRLLQENSTQADTLAEHNSRLQDELEKCRAVSVRVEGLEKENQRLAAELGQALQQRNPDHIPVEIRPSRITPGPSSEPSSSARSELNQSTGVSRAKHQELIAKYNAVCVNYKSMKEAKSKLEGIRDADKLKFRKWNSFKEEQDARIGKKDERILRLREEIQRLRSQLTEFTGDVKPYLADEVDLPLSTDLNDVQTPRTSPKKVGVVEEVGDTEDVGEGDPSLPNHRHDLDPHISLNETQFEGIEHRHSSSTSGSDPIHEVILGNGEDRIKQEPSEDTYSSPDSVIVISAKSIRKTKGGGKSNEPRNAMKIEDLESSPIGLAAIHNWSDSIDLDDIGEKVDTPRKRKRALELSRRISGLASSPVSPRSSHQIQGNSNSTEVTAALSERIPVVRKSSVLQPRSVNTPVLPRTSDDRAYKKRRVADDQAVGSLLEDGELGSFSDPAEIQNPGRLGNLLSSPSPKKQILNSTRLVASGNQAWSARTLAPSRLANEVERDLSPVKAYIAPCIPSSGLNKRRRGGGPHVSSKPSITPAPELAGKSLRDTPCFSAEPDSPSSRGNSNVFIASPRRMPTVESPFFEGPSGRGKDPSRLTEFFKNIQANTAPVGKSNDENSPFSKDTTRISLRRSAELSVPSSRQSVQSSTKRHFRLNRDDMEEPDVNPDHEPLRLRPMQSLTIGDFKINPNYNQGFKYAFSEVVRGKDARKCIQGCTKPGCCGYKFRALVEGMRDPNQPTTASQEEADTALLNEFLGRDAYKVQNMSKEERDEMVLQAKTREYANKHGKHRHAFERPSSPPGFWRADMPSTQEEIADRAKAKEKDKNTIEERYREAMRIGGKYMFRDE